LRLRDIAEPTVEQLRTLIADDFDETTSDDKSPIVSKKSQLKIRRETQGAQQ
jgi:hypothetical protein